MIRVYITDINNVSIKEKYLDVISPQRRMKIDRLVPERSKLLSLAAGLMLGRFFPGKEVSLGEFGKPYVKGGQEFNLAHSGDFVLFAVSGAEAVGCDIERIKDMDYARIARTVFHQNEIAAIGSAENKSDKFFELWTKKEAFMKCIGEGFHFNSTQIDLSFGDSVEYKGKTFFFKEYMLSGYKIMICSAEKDFSAEISEIEFE